jgi:hypothetical protein
VTPPEFPDLGPPDPGPPPSSAAAAANWRTVVAVDAAVGLVVLLAGVALSLLWQPVVGAGVASLGLVYTALVARRARRWAAWRRAAGLTGG